MKDYFKVLHIKEAELAMLSKPAKQSLILEHYYSLFQQISSQKKLTEKNKKTQLKELEEAKIHLINEVHSKNDSTFKADHAWINRAPQHHNQPVELNGESLSIDDIIFVSRRFGKIQLTKDSEILRKVEASHDYVIHAVKNGKNIYGVTTSFGGLAHIKITKESTLEMQSNLIHFLNAGTGHRLATEYVRAAIIVRANSLLQGASGIRLMLIQRMLDLLNLKLTPVVLEFGSIGASGDLVPLASVCGAMIGLSNSYKLNYAGKDLPATKALEKFKLPKIKLEPKEALAIVNGTAMMTGIAADCIYQAKLLLHLTMISHALLLQGIFVSNQPFDEFIHALKPHAGEIWAAKKMLSLLQGSKLIKDEIGTELGEHKGHLIQDRYSSRCLPQYIGPIAEGLEIIAEQVEIEANSVTDNPLIDIERKISLHGGNFLGQHMGVAMDELRFHIGMLAKHLDVQIACSVLPEFSNGLPPSLIGNPKRLINCGLKGLQICANSIAPVLSFLANPLVIHFPTHAEQYNQNINSQGLQSSVLAARSIEIFQQYLAIAIMFGIQAVGLRCFKEYGHYDIRKCLSTKTVGFYEIVFDVLGKEINRNRPYIWNDDEQSLEEHIAILTQDIKSLGKIPRWIFDNMEAS